MVSTRRFGRLGNELFQYAAVIGYAEKHGLKFSIPRKTNDPVWNPVHFPELYNPDWVEGREDVLLNENWNEFQHYQEIPFNEEWRGKQIVLNGYWQSWKYYDFCRERVLSAFNFPWELNKGVASIHVRRGDYLLYPTKHQVVTVQYLKSAIDVLHGIKGINKFKFFSDDIPWCLGCGVQMYFPEIEFEYSTGKTEMQDLIEMSCCEHQIVSNSTMSWWAHELNRNPAKVCVIPSQSNWFGKDNRFSVKDLYRENFIQIKY